jgi:hypothetical protein
MADERLDSIHLGFDPRREQYRRARKVLLQARGWLTIAAEQAHGLAGQLDDWPALLPAPQQMIPGTNYLLIEPRAGCAHPLHPGLNTIGRMANNDIVLEEIWVSRRHCVILVHVWGGCELHDTASRNGTFVNRQRVRDPLPLACGDRIRIIDHEFLLGTERDCLADVHQEDYSDTAVR